MKFHQQTTHGADCSSMSDLYQSVSEQDNAVDYELPTPDFSVPAYIARQFRRIRPSYTKISGLINAHLNMTNRNESI